MAAKIIRCERCLVRSGDLAENGEPIQFYKEEDGRIHCGACVDSEVEIEPGK